jgi:hypothetical protein
MMNHDVVLRGFYGGPPLIVERTDQRFIPSTMKVLSGPDPITELGNQKSFPAKDTDNNLVLYQPVHRTFNLALCEVLCEQYREPRLDPTKIQSAGFVIRRIVKSNPASTPFNGLPSTMSCNDAWVESEHVLKGWLPIEPSDELLDPDPSRRVDPFHAGPAEIRRRLAALQSAPLVESTTTLFPASADVCAQAKRTILFGVVPVTSRQAAEASEQIIGEGNRTFAYDDDQIDFFLPIYFKKGPGWNVDGIGGTKYDSTWADANSGNTYVDKYVLFLRTVQIILDLFGESAQSIALRNLVAQIKVYNGDTARSALDHLSEARDVILFRENGSAFLPDRWGGVSEALAAQLRTAVANSMNKRAEVALPAEGRYEDEKARYQLRAFVRVKRDDGCPPALVWSDPSAPFAIAPWYESKPGVPPVKIALPNVTRDNIKKFLPNVAFKVPQKLFCFLNQNTPKNLLEGKGQDCTDDSGFGGIDWFCGFNIPIITLCAFIILFIFLTLLNIIFWWLPFIRICIPLPRKVKI